LVIDIHAHYLPESAVRAHETGSDWHGTSIERGRDGVPVAVWNGRPFEFGSPVHFQTMDERVALSARRGVDTEVLSLLPPLFRYDRPGPDGIAAARELNDELSALTQRYPGRFLGLAALPMQVPDAAADELRRALALPGMVGVTIGTHVAGTNLDADELEPFFAAADEAAALVLVHPIAPRDRSALDSFYLRNVIGNPLETTIAAASLMASGRLERHERMTVCLAHGGGYTCAAAGRLTHAHSVRHELAGLGTRLPTELVRRFLYDSLTHDELALRQLIDTVGSDRVVLGTDFPADMGQPDAAAEIGASDLLTAAEKDAILRGNLHRLLPIAH
jgi:aminocarboxymuconate-semialdehyde decarboxylase